MLHFSTEIVLCLLGLCIGSFLNVVIYRLPAGLALHNPSRSFCPRCRVGIAWYDNLPVVSWFALGGRCRRCREPISVQYPLVEAATGLVFVLVYHLLVVNPSRTGLSAPRLPADAPLLASWLVFASALVVCTVMDVVSYTVDVRVTNAVVAICTLLAALWPRGDFLVPRAATTGAAAAAVAFLVAALMLWWTVWRVPESPEPPPPETQVSPQTWITRLAARLGVVVLVLATALLGLLNFAPLAGLDQYVIAAGLLAIFGTIVIAAGQRRPADEEITDALSAEAPHARRTAISEFIWLLPAIGAGVLTAMLLSGYSTLRADWAQLVGWSVRGLHPVAGVVYALHGAAVAAAAGWVLRLVFTLAYGKEAFGTGDIYILAAAGAAAGWDIALLGLLLSVGVALLAWLLGLLLKATTMIAFGPSLALGFLLALWWNAPAAELFAGYSQNLRVAWREHPEMLLIVGGLMLLGTVAALALGRFVRRLVPEA